MNFPLTVFTSAIPPRLTKQWRLDQTGNPEKLPGGQMVEGRAEIKEIAGVDGFAKLIQSLKPSQALAYGVPSIADGPVMTRQAWVNAGKPPSVICRTLDGFSFADGPGVLYLDIDAPEGAGGLTMEQARETLERVCPRLRECALVQWPSSSSFISNQNTGETVRGLAGQHMYYIVDKAARIPELGRRLTTLLWLGGLGRIAVSASGSLLERTMVDPCVWQPNRMDFAAGADCVAPLVQRRGEPFVRQGRMLDSETDIPQPSPAEEKQARQSIEVARRNAAPKAAMAKERYIEDRVRMLAGENATDEELQSARAATRKAMDDGVLTADFRIPVVAETGETAWIKVSELLDNPRKYHGADTLDPVDPEYDGGRTVGRLYFNGGSARLHSFAHGGRTFALVRTPTAILVVPGSERDVDAAVMKAMREDGSFFEQGGRLVILCNGRLCAVSEHALLYFMRAQCAFYSRTIKNGTMTNTPVSASIMTARVILSAGEFRGLPKLRCVVTAQTMMPSGKIVAQNGYDPETQLYFSVEEENILPIPEAPTREEAVAAFDRIMHPFRCFPFVDARDRSILLAAILSATVRPVLDTCPAFAYDAPERGSGKTLLAKCVHAIATGERACVVPHVGGGEEEIRKRVLAVLMDSKLCVVWDNVVGALYSEALAALLTSAEFSDRILGKSQTVTVSNAALWLFTGNNMMLSGDLPRRVFKCRIDPGTAQPFIREFDFDPEAFCLGHRHELVRDSLLLIRAWMAAGRPKAKGITASFEQWDELVRQPIAWMATLDSGRLVDPLEAMKDGQSADPENETLYDLLWSLHRHFKHRSFTAGDVFRLHESVSDFRRGRTGVGEPTCEAKTLHDAVVDLCPKGTVTAKKIGRCLHFRKDRMVDGYKLKGGARGQHGVEWIVEYQESAETMAYAVAQANALCRANGLPEWSPANRQEPEQVLNA
jgi:hypothetical protein